MELYIYIEQKRFIRRTNIHYCWYINVPTDFSKLYSQKL